jgi:hypothetical protein
MNVTVGACQHDDCPALCRDRSLTAKWVSLRQYVSPYYLAIVYVGLKQPETAVDYLEKAYADRSNGLVFLKFEPALEDLRSNPRFVALQQKLHFPA